jgi:putative endonuclease
MFFTYVIFSRNFNRFYKGHCQDIDIRLKEHNSGKTSSTKPFIPWEFVYYESFETIEGSVKREKYFKTAAGRRFLKKVLPHYFS